MGGKLLTGLGGPKKEPIAIADIKRLVIHPGETLMLTLPKGAPMEQGQQVGEYFKKLFPTVRVIIVTEGITAEVIADQSNPQ